MRLNVRLLTKFSDNVKELRIHLCQTGEASNGARWRETFSEEPTTTSDFLYNFNSLLWKTCREYVEKFYPELKKANPKLPILVRECSGVQPRLWARFGIFSYLLIQFLNISFYKLIFSYGKGDQYRTDQHLQWWNQETNGKSGEKVKKCDINLNCAKLNYCWFVLV